MLILSFSGERKREHLYEQQREREHQTECKYEHGNRRPKTNWRPMPRPTRSTPDNFSKLLSKLSKENDKARQELLARKDILSKHENYVYNYPNDDSDDDMQMKIDNAKKRLISNLDDKFQNQDITTLP